METETRNFSARSFGSLKERIVIGYFDLSAVNLNICHRLIQTCGSTPHLPDIKLFRLPPMGKLTKTIHVLFRSFQTDVAALNSVVCIFINPLFNFRTEITDQALNRPCSSITQSADRMTFNLFGDVQKHVNFTLLCIALDHAFHHTPHPAGAFTARRALAAAFMFEES